VRIEIERDGAALRRRIFSGEPEGQPVSFLLAFLWGSWDG
jgi:hypothetical protein